MKIRYKLFIAFLVIIAIFIAEGLYVNSAISTINALESGVNTNFKIYQDAVNYEKGNMQIENGVFLYMHNNADMGRQRVSEGLALMKDSRNDLKTLLTDPQMISDLSQMEQRESQVSKASDDVVSAVENNDTSALVNQKLDTLDADSESLNLMSSEFVDKTNINVAASLQQSKANGESTIVTLYASIVISVIVSILLAFSVATMITKPIKSLMDAANKISWGDMNVSIKVTSKDEIGDLAKSFNRMKNAFKVMDDLVKNASPTAEAPAPGIDAIAANRQSR